MGQLRHLPTATQVMNGAWLWIPSSYPHGHVARLYSAAQRAFPRQVHRSLEKVLEATGAPPRLLLTKSNAVG